MRRVKQHIALGLLIVFVVGGFAGQIVHRIHHTMEIAAANRAAHDHEHPQDGTSNVAAGGSVLWSPVDCVLCAPIVADLATVSLVAGPHPLRDTVAPASDSNSVSTPESNLEPRGPPTSA